MRTQGFLRDMNARLVFALACTAVALGVLFAVVEASSIHTYRDTLSDSAPGEDATHTIEFTTASAIPPGGFVRFTPEDGAFTIPATDFDVDNVELYVDSSLRTATDTAPTATDDAVTIVTGTSGHIEVTLNSTSGIDAGSEVRLVIGNETTNSTTTDLGIENPAATGTYEYRIETGDNLGSSNEAQGLVAIIDNVGVGPVNTTETIPPVRFNGAPSGTIAGTVTAVEVSLETDEFAECRYSFTPDTPFLSMTDGFDDTFTIVHS
ncbi:MAG TPA: hypothetical protein VFS75_02655, partial [Candidatus Paceibacterota bacterium]|nr:hypothetical protein [Candidatus Paceibacterota bacterium]